jgi:hypothetical protein
MSRALCYNILGRNSCSKLIKNKKMAIPILSNLVNGIKEGVKASLRGVSDISTTIIEVVKNNAINLMKQSGEFAGKGVQAAASIVKGAVAGVADVGASFTGAISGIVRGTIHGLVESGEKPEDAARGAVSQAVQSAKELGEDIGQVAVEAVKGSVAAVKAVGGDTASATKETVLAAVNTAKELGQDVFEAVKSSLEASIEGAKEIIEAAVKEKQNPEA